MKISERASRRALARERVPTAIVTVSDTRTFETDTGGALVASRLEEAGQPVADRRIVPDEPEAIRGALDDTRLEVAKRMSAGKTNMTKRCIKAFSQIVNSFSPFNVKCGD